MIIHERLVELLIERDIPFMVCLHDDPKNWSITYWPNGCEGPTEEMNPNTRICDLHWLT